MWVVIPFSVKNGLPIYQKIVTKTFHEYIDVSMKIFLNDFIFFSELSTHFEKLEKLKKCSLKCRKFDISLKPNKCAFMVFSRTILGFIVSKKARSWILRRLKL